MTSDGRLPLPEHLRDADGYVRVSAVWEHFVPMLSGARQAFDQALESACDPVLREAVRLRNARTLACDH